MKSENASLKAEVERLSHLLNTTTSELEARSRFAEQRFNDWVAQDHKRTEVENELKAKISRLKSRCRDDLDKHKTEFEEKLRLLADAMEQEKRRAMKYKKKVCWATCAYRAYT